MTFPRFIPVILSVVVFGASIIYSCNDTDQIEPSPENPTPYVFPKIRGFPTQLNVPDDNPTTVEGVELGRYLFYDGRLSGRTHPDSLMSCATCHIQKNGFECGLDYPKFSGGFPVGIPDDEYPEGKPTSHVMLPVVNLVYNFNGYFWSGFLNSENSELGSTSAGVPPLPEYNLTNIESVVWLTIKAQDEINGDVEKTVSAISGISMYPPMFEAAFGSEEVTYDRISKAIAQFVRTIIAYRSKFQKYLRDEAELTEPETRGFNLFFSEDGDCFHCHGGSALMTTNLYYNNAKDTVFVDPQDRYGVTGIASDQGAYKAPSLLNCELRAPYMHDGRFKTLEEVIDFYSEGLVYSDRAHPLMKQVHHGGVQLTQEQKNDLRLFLATLTDYELLSDPKYARPEGIR